MGLMRFAFGESIGLDRKAQLIESYKMLRIPLDAEHERLIKSFRTAR